MANLLHNIITKYFTQEISTQIRTALLIAFAMIEEGSVNLNKVKNKFGIILGNKATKADSHYRKMTRFFSAHSAGDLWEQILMFSASICNRKTHYVMLDGSSWISGKVKYHFMTLAIYYGGAPVPIYFEDLEKKGISSEQERIELFSQALRIFNFQGKTLLADREYAGAEFFRHLMSEGINFVIRAKRLAFSSYLKGGKKAYLEAEKKVLSGKVGKTIKLKVTFDGKRNLYLIMKKDDKRADEPILYFLSDLECGARKIADKYLTRWQIECCFKHLKSNGFDMEKMNLKGTERCRLLLAIAFLAYTTAVMEGLKKCKSVPIKKYADERQYFSKSIFKSGMEALAQVIHLFSEFLDLLWHSRARSRRYIGLNSILI